MFAAFATFGAHAALAAENDTAGPAANDKGGHGAGQVQPVPNEELSLEEKMRRRYPQPVKVGFLIGLPVLDWNDSTLGFVTNVVRTSEGKIQLVMPYGGWFGRGGRPVALPIETVAILARQIDLLEWGDKGTHCAAPRGPARARRRSARTRRSESRSRVDKASD